MGRFTAKATTVHGKTVKSVLERAGRDDSRVGSWLIGRLELELDGTAAEKVFSFRHSRPS